MSRRPVIGGDSLLGRRNGRSRLWLDRAMLAASKAIATAREKPVAAIREGAEGGKTPEPAEQPTEREYAQKLTRGGGATPRPPVRRDDMHRFVERLS